MPDTREKLIKLLNKAISYAIDNCKNENPRAILETRDVADYLIANGVTIEQPIDLSGKCGSCAYAKRVSGAFGNAKCYVRCTNQAHLKKHCKHASSELRQRTHKACKSYVPLSESPKEATP